MKRLVSMAAVGLSMVPGLLLVLALGSGALAQSPPPSSAPSPSLESTPLFSPDDLASILPSEVKSHPLTIDADDTEEVAGTPELREGWRDLLLSLGKVPTDLTAATGRTSPVELGGAMTQVGAFRVDGVVAAALVEPWLRYVAQVDPSDLPIGDHAEWQDIDGRSVLVLTVDDHPRRWIFLYPKGEVLFIAGGDQEDVSGENVLAALP
jgi:hypothetical protein